MLRVFLVVVACLMGSVAWGSDVDQFWPLEVGNWWRYHHIRSGLPEDPTGLDSVFVLVEEDTIELRVLRQEVLGGETYYRLSNGQALRVDGLGNVVEYNDRFPTIDSSEFILLDFSDTDVARVLPYSIFPPTLGRVDPPPSPANINPEDAVVVSAGGFAAYTVQYSLGVDLCMDASFARGVGPVRTRRYSDVAFEYETYSLVEAVVGSRHIGQSTAVLTSTWASVKANCAQPVEVGRGTRHEQ